MEPQKTMTPTSLHKPEVASSPTRSPRPVSGRPFPQLASEKNRSGQRVYRRSDIDLVFRIKKLLYQEEYTIAGARKAIEDGLLGGATIGEPSARPKPPARRSATDDLDTPPPIKPQVRSSLFEHEEAHAPIETAPAPVVTAAAVDTSRDHELYDNALRTIDELRRELGVVVEARDRIKERSRRIADRLQAALNA